MKLFSKKQKSVLKDWINTIFWAGIIAIAFRSILLEPFNIPSGSMIPNLHVGDHLFVSKWNYGYSRFSFPFGSWNLWNGRVFASNPKQGQIIVFRKPDGKDDYIKRLIGLPGDKIQMKNGRLYINDSIVQREAVSKYALIQISKNDKHGASFTDSKTGDVYFVKGNKLLLNEKIADFDYTIEYKEPYLCEFSPYDCKGLTLFTKYVETLPNGLKHDIIEISDNAFFDNTDEFIVPENHYFMMGDDRDLSSDSRDMNNVGFVPRDNLIGRAWFVFYSHNYYSPLLMVWNWPEKIRFDRFFNGVRQ